MNNTLQMVLGGFITIGLVSTVLMNGPNGVKLLGAGSKFFNSGLKTAQGRA